MQPFWRGGVLGFLGSLWIVGNVHADMAPPPTFLIDSYMLGQPMGWIVGISLFLAAIAMFIFLRRRGFRRWRAVILTYCLYAAANFAVYIVGLGEVQRQGKERREQWQREYREKQEREAKEKEAGKSSDAETPPLNVPMP